MIGVDDLQGRWRRDWLRAPGLEDSATAVHWLQAGALYADIRIPADRPDVAGAAALADLPDAALLALLRAEGFAGTIAVADDVCVWTRAINWHGRPEGEDAGQLSFGGPDRLIETGVHADYAEQWRREAAGPVAAQRFAVGGAQGFLVTVGDRFAFAMGRPGAAPSRPAVDALRESRRTPALGRLFDGFHAFGRWEGAAGVVELATDPLREGRAVLRRDGGGGGGGTVWEAVDFEGRVRPVALAVAAAA